MAGLEAELLALFANVQTFAVNAEEEEQEEAYALSPEAMLALIAAMAIAADRWIVGGRPNAGFWFQDYTEQARRLGLTQASVSMASQSDAYATLRPLQSVFFSSEYITETGNAVVQSYGHWKGLSDETASRLSEIISSAVKNRTPKLEVIDQITALVGVTESKAKRIADTDIPMSVRDVKLQEAEQAAKDLQTEVKLLWSSALTPTTRAWHASRHGRTYTRAEVVAFYAVRGNKYNCKCSVTPIISDADMSPAIQQRMKAARVAWQKEYV